MKPKVKFKELMAYLINVRSSFTLFPSLYNIGRKTFSASCVVGTLLGKGEKVQLLVVGHKGENGLWL